MIENEIQKEILSNCSFRPKGARFSELKPKSSPIENDLFNYHLKYLVKNEYLLKEGSVYTLTLKGKSLVTNIDHATKQLTSKFKVSTYMCPVKDGKILLYKRLKHPQYGYTGFISGKIAFGDTIMDTVSREFKEETNLEGEFKLIGNMRQIRRNSEGEVVEDGIFYICYTDKISGDLIPKSKEGEYFWVDIKDVVKIEKLFKPSVEIGIKELRKRLSGKVSWDSMFIYELQPDVEEY